MQGQDEHRIRYRRHFSQFAGMPIYIFDVELLLKSVALLAGRTEAELKTAVGTCLDATLANTDVKISVDNGFYLVFANRTSSLAADRAQAVSTAVLDHLVIPAVARPKEFDRFCRPSGLKELATDLGISPNSPRAFVRPGAKPSRPVTLGRADGDSEQLAEDLTALFVDHLLSAADEHVLYSPIWDNKKSRISAFGLGLGAAHRRGTEAARAVSDALTLAIAQAKVDIAVLAWATRGARRIVKRGEIALVSAPLHVETLSWSKTRNAYLDVLSQIEPRSLPLIAPRIVGLDPGSNLAQIAQWSRALQHYVRGIFVHLPGINVDFSRTGILGVTGFGLTAHTNRTSLAEEAGKLAHICAEQNAVAFIDNVISPAELSLLKRKGIRFISGPLIGPPAALPARMNPPVMQKASAASA